METETKKKKNIKSFSQEEDRKIFFLLLFKAAKCNRQAEYFDWPSETNWQLLPCSQSDILPFAACLPHPYQDGKMN